MTQQVPQDFYRLAEVERRYASLSLKRPKRADTPPTLHHVVRWIAQRV
jgi:hypothetical protein